MGCNIVNTTFKTVLVVYTIVVCSNKESSHVGVVNFHAPLWMCHCNSNAN